MVVDCQNEIDIITGNVLTKILTQIIEIAILAKLKVPKVKTVLRVCKGSFIG